MKRTLEQRDGPSGRPLHGELEGVEGASHRVSRRSSSRAVSGLSHPWDGLEVLHEAAHSPQGLAPLGQAHLQEPLNLELSAAQPFPSIPNRTPHLRQQHGAGPQQHSEQPMQQQGQAHLRAQPMQKGASPEPAYKRRKAANLTVTVPIGGAAVDAKLSSASFTLHAYTPGADRGATATPWGVALGQTLATPALPQGPLSAEPTPQHAGSVPGWGTQGPPAVVHSNAPSPTDAQRAAGSGTSLHLHLCRLSDQTGGDLEETEAARVKTSRAQAAQGVPATEADVRSGKPQGAGSQQDQRPSPGQPCDAAPQVSMRGRSGVTALKANAVDRPMQAVRAHAVTPEGSPHQPSQAERLSQMEDRVRILETQLGLAHPQVGKAWLALSRAYQAQRNSQDFTTKAERALVRAWQICSACYNNTHCKRSSNCEQSFDYLLDRIRSLNHQPNKDVGSMQNMVPIDAKPL
eukprot:jgi/Astpho2/533/Aster-x0935